MKLCSSKKEYIDAIAPAVQRACKRYGYLPSVLIGQSCLENGFGVRAYFDNPEITLLLEANNMVGIKSNLLSDSWNQYTVWGGESIKKKTPEEYGGSIETITDKFRKYNSIEESFVDYLLFMKYGSNYGPGGKPKYGDEVLRIKDPETLIKTVSARGYATGSTYPKSVMRIIRENNLTKYDDLTNVKPTDITAKKSETKKEEKQMTKINIIDITNSNTPVRWDNTREALVFHFLGVAGADNPYLYGGGYGGQWYISRKGEIYHAVKPGGTVYAVGSGGWGLKTTKWNNSNTENVEMGCECDGNKNDIFDKKWWFHMATQEAAVKFARYWLEMRGYGVSEKTVNERILVHNSITNKPCPAPWLHGAGYSSPREKGQRNWSFEEFKKKIWQGYSSKAKSYLSKGDSGEDVRAMQKLLIQAGFSCGKTGADGDFGTNTENALKAFQKAAWILADGKYTETVKKALTAYINKNKKEDSKKESKEKKKSTWKATGTATATVDDLNVRKGPGTNYDIIRSLNTGNRFEVDGKKDGRWIHVKVIDDIGWIHERYVEYDR